MHGLPTRLVGSFTNVCFRPIAAVYVLLPIGDIEVVRMTGSKIVLLLNNC